MRETRAAGDRQPGFSGFVSRLLRPLLDGDGGAGALQGRPRLVRALLVDLLQHRLGRAVHQVLGLLQAQAGQAAHLLDDLDLLVARSLEDDVELVLLLGLLGLGAAGRAGGHRDGRGRLHVERLLELLDELGQLQEGHLLERLKQVGATHLRHVVVPSLSLRYVGSGQASSAGVSAAAVSAAAVSAAAVPPAAASRLARSASASWAIWAGSALNVAEAPA